MKTIQIVEAYNTVNSAKITKMSDADKFVIIKAMRVLKPLAKSFEEFKADAQEKLKGEEFDEMQRKAQQWQSDGENTTLTIDERIAINTYFNDYAQRVDSCVKEEQEKEVEAVYDRLSEEAFGQFIASNDYDVSTIMKLEEVLC